LTEEQAKAITTEKVLGEWKPKLIINWELGIRNQGSFILTLICLIEGFKDYFFLNLDLHDLRI
jgi:hypothetical protein